MTMSAPFRITFMDQKVKKYSRFFISIMASLACLCKQSITNPVKWAVNNFICHQESLRFRIHVRCA